MTSSNKLDKDLLNFFSIFVAEKSESWKLDFQNPEIGGAVQLTYINLSGIKVGMFFGGLAITKDE